MGGRFLLSAIRNQQVEEQYHMVSSEQFRKPEPEKEPEAPQQHQQGGFPLTHEATVKLLRDQGVIPDWVPDSAVMVTAVKPSTGEVETLTPPGAGTELPDVRDEWHLDDVFPHTRFDDPPGNATPEQYKQMLMNVLSASADLEEFTVNLAAGLGPDLVVCHGVPGELAMQVCIDFASKIYKEYREHA